MPGLSHLTARKGLCAHVQGRRWDGWSISMFTEAPEMDMAEMGLNGGPSGPQQDTAFWKKLSSAKGMP